MSHAIYFNFIINAHKECVFNAVSQPNEFEKWWPLKCSGTPGVGKVYNFNFTDKYDWYAVVKNYEINNHIHFKMTKSNDDWNPTTFGFDLEPKNEDTYLKFFHKDWPENNDHFKFSSFCWAMLLKGLKDYLEKGIIIPFADRE